MESKPYVRPKFKVPPLNDEQSNGSPNGGHDEHEHAYEHDESKQKPLFNTKGEWTPIQTPRERVAAWEASRLMTDGPPLPASYSRPLTRRNLGIALRLAPVTLAEVLLLYWNAAGVGLVLYMLGNVMTGMLPAWHAVTLANLLDCVQDTLASNGPIDKHRIIKLALINLFAAQAERILDALLYYNNQNVRYNIDEKIEYLYLKSQLTLDIPTLSDDRVAPLLTEAGAFAGFESFTSSNGQYAKSPSRQMVALTDMLRDIVALVSRSSVVIHTILGTTKQGTFSLSTVLFLFMSFLPSLLGFLTVVNHHWSRFFLPPMTKREIHELGRNGQYKQEILLFGLGDWVMDKWRQANDLTREERDMARDDLWKTGVNMARDSVESVCYALIALGAFPTSISIGNMRLCQTCADSLVNIIKHLNGQMEELVLYVYLGTAFVESLRIQDTLLKSDEKRIDYASVQHLSGRRGMRIEAKNLSFTYPGAQTPTLKDINIVIEPGETLAIVGFNGGGKTTLVKVLMGLYDYQGTLLINDKPASSYTRSSLHAHTTVCFQDYAKYNLTVKDNVGTGNYPKIDDQPLMMDALRKGGADAVVSKFPKGIEEELDKFWNPARGEDMAPAQVPSLPPPPPMGGMPPPGPPPPGLGGGPPGPPPPGAIRLPSGPVPKGRKGKHQMRLQLRDAKSLSGGQWQRIALARAFMRSDEADLVVFDEPSASLDARAEHELFERIHSLSLSETGEKIRTTVYVSHRFSTTRRADKIAVVEEGTITELGSHDELMKLGGRYAEFFNLQAKAFVD
ncbi:hypothetical protein M407DRAFT_22503 [Tulasnella calospora MUT 4182]|uniref:ABC transporter domain-containing protein n=1 Tax=Tulasnella calospora MUT 4182 TaxID=1051891 RepID=A0A0C3QMX2_9AGAM|nr:hypothetical protein M407DRAFT_22503 [Tulasnella calospora MUT 4182]